MKNNYKYRQLHGLWGLYDRQLKWVVAPIYDEVYDFYEEYYSRINSYIFKKNGLYFIFTLGLINLFPEGVVNYIDCRLNCEIDYDSTDEYFFVVEGENGLFGLSYFFRNDRAPNNTCKKHLIIEWERIFHVTHIGCSLIKGQDLYYLYYYDELGTLEVYNYRNKLIRPSIYYDFIQKNREIALPECKQNISDTKFYAIVKYCRSVLDGWEKPVPEYKNVLIWMKPFYKKKQIYGLFYWLFLKLFADNYDGNKIPKKYKYH